MVEMAQNLEGYICYDEFWLSKETNKRMLKEEKNQFIILVVVHMHISTIFPLNFFLPLLNSV